jgi:hypothetical protein
MTIKLNIQGVFTMIILSHHVRHLGILFVVVLLSTTASSPGWGKTGVLIVAHGSPSPAWNQPILDFTTRVDKEAVHNGLCDTVCTAFLEFATPDIPSQVAHLEELGCDRIISIPLFIIASSHTHFDVPAVLGIYSSQSVLKVLEGEGVKVARSKIPITLTNTCSEEGNLLEEFLLAQIRELSVDPKDESLVILLHGDSLHNGLIEEKMRALASYCCGETGIRSADWASIGVGQDYLETGISTISRAIEHNPRVLVVSLYVSTTAKKIHDRVVGQQVGSLNQKMKTAITEGKVVFSNQSLIEQPGLMNWVLNTIRNAK